MQLEKLQIELRPRSNAQALDLGLALLHAQGASAVKAWLALWLPWVLVCTGALLLKPEWSLWWFVLLWWPRPLLERITLYVLSRQVFGEPVTWRAALKAWPRQLGGGMFALLTWFRPFAAGRSLMQPVWQLEGARGKVARERRRVLGLDSTARAAFWYGAICAYLEVVIQVGVFAAVGFFASDESAINPFSLFTGDRFNEQSWPILLLSMGGMALSGAIFGPLYTASGFTLYLNRRARLEAWDIEIALRQIKPPAARRGAGVLAMLLAAPLLSLALGQPAPAMAADAPVRSDCTPEAPKPENRPPERAPVHSPEQAKLRAQVDALYAHPDLRGYVCEDIWRRKNAGKDEKIKLDKGPDLTWLAIVFKLVSIAAALGLVAWLIYRFRDKFPSYGGSARAFATEVAGLDIRASSLPDDVPGTVRALWDEGQRRAALALLYRATLARLVQDKVIVLRQGDTEGDCLRLAQEAAGDERLDAARMACTRAATGLWLGGAYGQRWPTTDAVHARCSEWAACFDRREAP